jgi:copper chaperone CopZ
LPLKEHSTHLESALRAVDGLDNVKVNLTTGTLEVQYDAQKVDLSRLVGTVKSVGFQCQMGLVRGKLIVE